MSAAEPVLVVEDDESFRQALSRWLEALAYRCVLAESVEEAVREYPKQKFCAVLLDLHLPGRSGHVFLRQLRGIGSETPVIVVSGGAEIDDVILAMRQGAADFLRKPFRIDELSAALSRATKSHVAPPEARLERTTSVSQALPLVATAPPAGLATAPPAGLATAPARPTLSTLIEHIRKGSVKLPVVDAQLGRIARLLASPDVDSDELQGLVESDANLTATLLRTANSAYYSRGIAMKTVREAATRLGSRGMLNVVTGAALQARLRVRGPFAELSRRQWMNNLATSRICGELARILRRTDGERLQLFGLIHNLGELVFLHLVSELELAEEPSTVLSQMSAIHEDVGLALVKSWRMSSDICRIVGSHHQISGGDYEFENTRFIVLASWHLAIQFGFSYLPAQVGEPGDALAELGLTEDSLATLSREAKHWAFD